MYYTVIKYIGKNINNIRIITGLLTWSVFVTELDALRGSAVVLQARAKADKKNSVRTYYDVLAMFTVLATIYNQCHL